MVKDDLRSLMIWVITVVVVLQAVQCNLSNSIWQQNKTIIAEKQKYYAETLTADEIDEFIRYWPVYNQLDLSEPNDISLSVDKKTQIDLKTKIWFVYHRLDFERFMYIRLRLKELLSGIDKKQQAQAVAEQLSHNKDELSKEMMIKHQNYADAIKLDPAETEIIKQREDELKQLFKLYP
jgi:hypothetical protein